MEPYQPIDEKAPKLVLRWQSTNSEKQIHGLRQTGPSGDKGGCWKSLECREAASVIGIALIDKRDKRASIAQDHNRPSALFSSK